METIKKTRQEFQYIFQNLLAIKTDQGDKLSYYVARLVEAHKKIKLVVDTGISDINHKYCLTDKETGAILYDIVGQDQRFKFDKKGQDEAAKEINKYLEVEIDVPVFIYSGPSRNPDVPLSMKMALEGILFPEITEDDFKDVMDTKINSNGVSGSHKTANN